MPLELTNTHIPGRLHPVTQHIPTQGVIALVGTNGSGKSTLLQLLAGLLPYHGSVQWNQLELADYTWHSLQRHRLFLPQQLSIPPDMSVLDNITQWDEAWDEVDDALGLRPLLAKRLGELSGGERQRVLLACALRPALPRQDSTIRLVLLDEPLTGLDWVYQWKLLQLLQRLRQQLTVIYVVHDLNIALGWSDYLWGYKAGHSLGIHPTASVTAPLLSEWFDLPLEGSQQRGQYYVYPQILT